MPVGVASAQIRVFGQMWTRLLIATTQRLVVAVPLLACSVAVAAPDEPVAIGARITGDASRTILTLELSKPITYKVFALEKPYRVLIDIPAGEFRLPPTTGAGGFGLVSSFRFGMVGPGKSRVVIETNGPILVESAGILSKDGTGQAQFKIALAKTDAATFAARLPRAPVKVKAAAPVEAAIALAPKIQDSATRRGLPLVVLDPGHGGPDSGAVGPDGAEEKNMVLAISKRVRELLEATGQYRVEMTRDTDVFITLEGRVDYAEKHEANLMVSIHADSTAAGRHWQPTGGATVYTFSETASNEEARVLALRENMSDKVAGTAPSGDDRKIVSDWLTEEARFSTRTEEQLLAEQTVAKLAKVVPMTLLPRRSARFYVLKSPKVPAMLVETGYMNNRQDSGHLQSAEWRSKLAEAVVASIQAFFAERGNGIRSAVGLDQPQAMQ